MQNNADNRSVAPRPSPNGGWSVKMGVVLGIPIRLHFTFFLLLAWLIASSAESGRFSALIFVVGLFACVVLHELVHCLVAKRYGIGISEIILYPIGGVGRMDRMPAARQELWVALAGPATNFVIAAMLSGVRLFTIRAHMLGATSLIASWWGHLIDANIFLCLFNMIPAFPMDGGRVLRALLGLRLGEVRATEIASNVGQLLAMAIGFYGFRTGNPILIFIAFFVFLGAGQEAMMYRGKALAEGLLMRDAMITDFQSIGVGATLQDAFDLLLKTSQQDFPVVHGDEVVGMLSRRRLLRGYQSEGPEAYVAGVMDRNYPVAAPDTGLEGFVTEMQTGLHPYVLVMTGDHLEGIVTTENLAELLILREIQRKKRPS